MAVCINGIDYQSTTIDRVAEPEGCPYCGRDLDGEEREIGLCDSDDCPRNDTPKECPICTDFVFSDDCGFFDCKNCGCHLEANI